MSARADFYSERAADSPSATCRFNEPSGSVMTNCSGQSGTNYHSNYTLGQASGIFGDTDTAVRYNGGTQYSQGNSTAAWGYAGTYSAEVWVKPAAISNSVIVSLDDNWAFGLASGTFRFHHRRQSPWQVDTISTTGVTPTVGTWYHLVATYDSSTLRLYVNGVQRGSAAVGTGQVGVGALRLGYANGGWVAGTGYYDGTIDELAFYSGTTLSAARVLAHWNGAQPPIVAISGNAFSDEGGSVWGECDGTTPNISVSVNGAAKQSTSCDDLTGAFSIDTSPTQANLPIAVFLDPATPRDRGVTYTRNVDLTSNISGLVVTRDRIRVRSETSRPISNADINRYDSTQDTDIPANSTGTDLSVSSSTELLVEAGDTYAPGGAVTVTSLDVRGSFVGDAASTQTITGSGTGACSDGPEVQRPLCVSGGGTFLPGSASTTRFTGPNDLDVQGATYSRLDLLPAGGGPTYQLGAGDSTFRINDVVTIGNGTAAVTASTSAYSPTIDGRARWDVNSNATLSGTGIGTITSSALTGAGTVDLTAGSLVNRQERWNQAVGPTGSANWFAANYRLENGFAFGTTGIATFNSAGSNVDGANAVVVAPDGRVHVAGTIGTNGSDWVLRTYTEDGQLDTSMDGGGSIAYNSGASNVDSANDVAVDSEGSIYVAGAIGTNSFDWAVRKYDASGDLCDGIAGGSTNCPLWGTAGMVTYDSGGAGADRAGALVVNPDRSIIVAGTQGTNGTDIAARMYSPSGTLDTNWGTAGVVSYNSGGTNADVAADISLGRDGAVYISGTHPTNGGDVVVRRHDANGVLCDGLGACPTWGTAGMVTYNSGGAANDSAGGTTVGTDGGVYVAATSNVGVDSDWVLRRYSPTGVLSWTRSFGNAGVQDAVASVALDGAGRVYVAGIDGSSSAGDYAVRAYDASGALCDGLGSCAAWPATGGTGMRVVVRATTESLNDLTVGPSGDIVMAGATSANGGDIDVVTLDADGVLRDSTTNSYVAAGGGSGLLRVTDLAIGSASDAGTTSFRLDSNNRALDVDDDLDITSKGALTAAATAALTVGGDFTRSGSFTHSSGTITFDTAATTSTITGSGPTTFGSITSTTSNKVLAFDHDDTVTVAGALTLDGGACTTLVKLRSAVPGNRFDLDATGSAAVQFTQITDSSAVTPRSATSSEDGGNNVGWTIDPGSCYTTSLSVTSGPTVVMGPIMPGVDQSAQTTVKVTTNNPGGYTLTATDLDDTTGATRNLGGDAIQDWTDLDASPGPWAIGTTGTDGYFGVSVLGVTGGRHAKWGAGSSTATDFLTNKYVGLKTTATTLHTAAVPRTDDIVTVGLRVNAAPDTQPGAYSGTISYTATPNP